MNNYSRFMFGILLAGLFLILNVCHPLPSMAQTALQDIIINNSYTLGAGIVLANPRLLKVTGLSPPKGRYLIVCDTYQNSPATKADLRVGDLISAINDIPVRKLNHHKPVVLENTPIKFHVLRHDTAFDISLKPIHRSDMTDPRYPESLQFLSQFYRLTTEYNDYALGRFPSFENVSRVRKQMRDLSLTAQQKAQSQGLTILAETYRIQAESLK